MRAKIAALCVVIAGYIMGSSQEAQAVNWSRVISGCLSMGAVTGGGTVLAVSMSDPSAKLDPSALVGSVGIGCIAGLFYANSVGERAEREAEAGLKVENQQLRRDYQQSQHTLCILKNTCHIDGTPKSASEMKKEMERLDKATSTLQSGN